LFSLDPTNSVTATDSNNVYTAFVSSTFADSDGWNVINPF